MSRSASAQTALTIRSVVVNEPQWQLTVSGTNICATPTVVLGETPLSLVGTPTATSLIATLPLPSNPTGTYYLVVSCGALAGRTASFVVALGALGPQGPPGTNGTNGTNGADGTNGTNGANGSPGADGQLGEAGLQGPPGTVALFDDLAGLACTRVGSLGTIVITYAANGDATLRCDLSMTPPTANFSGTYAISPVISYSCGGFFGLGLLEIDISSLLFSASGATLVVTGSPTNMRGVVTGSSFSVQGIRFGGVTETYSLSGTFQPNNAVWNGTFQASFSGPDVSSSGCFNRSFTIAGTRE